MHYIAYCFFNIINEQPNTKFKLGFELEPRESTRRVLLATGKTFFQLLKFNHAARKTSVNPLHDHWITSALHVTS